MVFNLSGSILLSISMFFQTLSSISFFTVRTQGKPGWEKWRSQVRFRTSQCPRSLCELNSWLWVFYGFHQVLHLNQQIQHSAFVLSQTLGRYLLLLGYTLLLVRVLKLLLLLRLLRKFCDLYVYSLKNLQQLINICICMFKFV